MTVRYIDVSDPSYKPGRLLDATSQILGCENDAQLARALGISGPQVWRIRNLENAITDRVMVAIMDRTGWHVTKVRDLMGVPFDNDED
jgi:hypothetical protein